MMNKLRRTGLLLIVSLIFCSLSAQENYLPGYIIRTDKEKLNGYIDYRGWEKNPDYVRFKTEIDGDIKLYSPLDIAEFGVDNDVYISAIVETEVSPADVNKFGFNPNFEIEIDTLFLQTLFNGNKELYYYKSLEGKDNFYIRQGNDISLLSYKEYFKETEDSYKTFAKNNRYIGQLTLYLSDCPEVQPRLRNTEYSKRGLETLFTYYYKCTDADPTFSIEKAKPVKEFGLVAGTTFTSMKFLSDDFDFLVKADVEMSASFTGGIFLNVIMPRNLGKLSLNNELIFSSYNVVMTYDEEQFNHVLYTSEFDYSFLKFNTMVRYKHPVGAVSLFVDGGVSLGYVLNGSNRMDKNFYQADRIEEYPNAFGASKIDRAAIAGIGVMYKRFSFETRFEIGDGIIASAALLSLTSRYHFLLGFRF